MKIFILSDLPAQCTISLDDGYFYVELKDQLGLGEYGVGESVHRAIADFFKRQAGGTNE